MLKNNFATTFSDPITGNEFSLYMLFVSSFILNKCSDIGPGEFQYRIYPFIHERDNVLKWDDIETEVKFPDVNILTTENEGGQMNMSMGEFLDVYQTSDSFDSILSVFFIDTAHNVADYIEKIHKILRKGGLWVCLSCISRIIASSKINNGPLLYHYTEVAGEDSVELSWEEIKQIIKMVGFTIEVEHSLKGLTYTQNPERIMRNTFDTIFFVARKT